MRRLFYRWLSKWGDSALRRDNERLADEVSRQREELQAAQSKLRIQSLEIDALAAVLARNVKRIEAETAAAARQIAANE